MKKIISFLSVMVVFSGFVVLNSWADEKQEALCPVKDFTAAGCTESEAIPGEDCTAFGTWGATGKCINAQLGKGLTCAAMSCESGKKMWIARVIDKKTGENKIMSMGRCHTYASAAANACVSNCECILDGKPACKPRMPTSQELAEANNADYGTGIDTLTKENSFICYCDKANESKAEQIGESKPEPKKECPIIEHATVNPDDCSFTCDEGYKKSDEGDSCVKNSCEWPEHATVMNDGNCTVTECESGYRPSKNGKECEQVCSYTAELYCKDGKTHFTVTFKEDDFDWNEQGGVYNSNTGEWDFQDVANLYEFLKTKNSQEYKTNCEQVDEGSTRTAGTTMLDSVAQDPTCSNTEHIKLQKENEKLKKQIADAGADSTEVNNAQEKLKKFFITLDKNRSVWKNADGSFNAVRLASDLTAGVVLGTVGGVVSGVLIKKSQVEKGFDALHCTVGGQKIADWGDEFRVGLRR